MCRNSCPRVEPVELYLTLARAVSVKLYLTLARVEPVNESSLLEKSFSGRLFYSSWERIISSSRIGPHCESRCGPHYESRCGPHCGARCGPHCGSRWGPQSGAIAACLLGFVQACICLLNELVHGKGILVLLVAQAHAYCYMV